MPQRMRIGIDLGGTKIEGLVLGRGGIEHARTRIATPDGSYRDTIDAVVGLIGKLQSEAGRRCTVGIEIGRAHV